MLRSLGFKSVWRIGADTYYIRGERCPSPTELLALVEKAHDAMIVDFRALSVQEGTRAISPMITRRLFGDISVSIGGRSASWLRSVRKRIGKSRVKPKSGG
jgi:hypothetical protein